MKVPKFPRWARWLVLGAGGALVLAAAATDVESTPEMPAKQGARQEGPRRAPPTAAGGDAVPAARLELERLEPPRQATGDANGNVFGATSWYVPPPPPPAAPPPPPPTPTAPPLPFTYLGIYADAGVPVLILSKGDRVYTVSPGDVIDGTYRLESVAGRSAELTFLPLGARQTLAVGGT